MSRTSLRLVALSIALVAGTLLAPATSSAATANPVVEQFGAVKCGRDAANARLCITSSQTYPATVGWFGYLAPSSPCNGSPFAGYWPTDSTGICALRMTEAWKWTSSGFVRSSLPEGARGYVHPYATGWRWLYVKDSDTAVASWYVLRDSDLSLLWHG